MKVNHKKISANDLNGLSATSSYNRAKRQLREPIMQAFDIYKSNVYYGVITETEEEKATVLAWYNDLCDLKENAFICIPEKIKKHIRK